MLLATDSPILSANVAPIGNIMDCFATLLGLVDQILNPA